MQVYSAIGPVCVGILLYKSEPPADNQLKAPVAVLEKVNALHGQLIQQAEVQMRALEEAGK